MTLPALPSPATAVHGAVPASLKHALKATSPTSADAAVASAPPRTRLAVRARTKPVRNFDRIGTWRRYAECRSDASSAVVVGLRRDRVLQADAILLEAPLHLGGAFPHV